MDHKLVHPAHYHLVIRMVNNHLLVFYSLHDVFQNVIQDSGIYIYIYKLVAHLLILNSH
jgi:hypothetical protein